MNCSLLDDEEYVNSTTEMIPVGIAEGREELSDDRDRVCGIGLNITYELMLAVTLVERQSKEKKRKQNSKMN